MGLGCAYSSHHNRINIFCDTHYFLVALGKVGFFRGNEIVLGGFDAGLVGLQGGRGCIFFAAVYEMFNVC